MPERHVGAEPIKRKAEYYQPWSPHGPSSRGPRCQSPLFQGTAMAANSRAWDPPLDPIGWRVVYFVRSSIGSGASCWAWAIFQRGMLSPSVRTEEKWLNGNDADWFGRCSHRPRSRSRCRHRVASRANHVGLPRRFSAGGCVKQPSKHSSPRSCQQVHLAASPSIRSISSAEARRLPPQRERILVARIKLRPAGFASQLDIVEPQNMVESV